jgi:hypothetical protein
MEREEDSCTARNVGMLPGHVFARSLTQFAGKFGRSPQPTTGARGRNMN